MEKKYLSALCGCAASLGFNWIYNMPYLEKLSKSEDLLFQKADKEVYKKAKKAFYAYPFSDVGDVSMQGDILKWLVQALNEDNSFNRKDYQSLVYEKIKPGGYYRGWVESYGKQLIYNHLSESLKTDNAAIRINDEQLVGFMPYIACKTLGLSNKKAWDLTQAFSSNPLYYEFFEFFDKLYSALENNNHKEVLKEFSRQAPEDFKDLFTQAVNLDTKSLIKDYVNTACHINNALPLIYHILYQSDSYEDALRKNTVIGGASSDRGLILGYLLSAIYEVPSHFIDKVQK